MLRYLLDTDPLTLYEQRLSLLGQRLLKEPAGTVGRFLEQALADRMASRCQTGPRCVFPLRSPQ